MTGRSAAVCGLGVAIVLLGTACTRQKDRDPAPATPGGAAPTRVTVVRPGRGGVERTVTRPGTVHAFQYADLYAKVAGYLRNQKVDIGSTVKEGEVLADVYAPELEQDVARADADLSKARAQVAASEAHRRSAEAAVKEAQQKVEQQKTLVASSVATVALRKAEYTRMQGLAKDKAIEQELVDEKLQAKLSAEAEERASRVAVTTAESAVTAAEAKLAAARADVENARAAVKVAEAALTRARVVEEYTHIRAPFGSVVTRRTYHNGDFIENAANTRQQPVLRVARTDKMRVIVDVPDPDVPYTRPGTRAEVRIDSLPGTLFPGAVARTAGAEDYTTRTMRTEVDLSNPDGTLADGMFGRVTLFLGKTATGLSLPSECFAGPGKDGKRPVFVVRDGAAHRIEVPVGLDDGARAEVLSGLTPTDQVVHTHSAGLTDGGPVRVVPDAAPAAPK